MKRSVLAGAVVTAVVLLMITGLYVTTDYWLREGKAPVKAPYQPKPKKPPRP